jgi:malonyl-CoA decarboxylase
MTTGEWISRKVTGLLPVKSGRRAAAETSAASKAGGDGAGTPRIRSTQERLKATLRRQGEALSPRALRQLLADLQAVFDPRVSEVEGGQRAQGVMRWSAHATPEERRDLWLLMSEAFAPDVDKVKVAREDWEAAIGSPDQGAAEIRLQRALVSQRNRLLQRFAVEPEGMRFLVDLRAQLIPAVRTDKRLLPLDAELEGLFSTWFDVAFLELRRISWDSPASLIEKLIQYEAVHDIRSWADVKNRLDSDRRCYGFFHPKLPNEPLIFVEVALLDHMADSITPLLDEGAAPADLKRATTAIFYSISNTQTGLKGVSFGDSLIKRVVESLKQEFAQLKHFATLSPIPGFRPWLQRQLSGLLDDVDAKTRDALGRAAGFTPVSAEHLQRLLTDPLALPQDSAIRGFLIRAVATYLTQMQDDGKPLDAVARFHLGNGARIERINWGGDPSAKGLRQSCGLMVNYLYDLKHLDRHREQLAQGKVPASRSVLGLVISR